MKKSKGLVLLLALLASSVSSPNNQQPRIRMDYDLTSFELQKFQDHALSRLPAYQENFRKYSGQYKIPWTLLAAVAYQESKWNNAAVSHTGVRGLMQLTSQ